MDKLAIFCLDVKEAFSNGTSLSVPDAQKVVKKINDFLYTRYISSLPEEQKFKECPFKYI